MAVFAVAAILSPLLLFIAVQTPPGKRLALSLITRQVAARTPFTFEASGVRGIVPFTLSVEKVVVRDVRGDWLEIVNLSARGDVPSLLRGRFCLTSLHAEEVRLERRPVKPRRLRVPVIPLVRWWPGVRDVGVDKITLDGAVFGQQAVYGAGGRLDWRGWGQVPDMELSARRADGPASEVLLSLSHPEGTPQLALSVEDEGIVPAFFALPGPFSAKLQGGGGRADWKGTLTAALREETLLEGNLDVRSGDLTEITGALSVRPPDVPRMAPVRRLFGPRQDLEMALSVTQAGHWTLRNAMVAGGTLRLSLAGDYDLSARTMDFSGTLSAPDGLPEAFSSWVALDATRGVEGAFSLRGPAGKPVATLSLRQGNHALLHLEQGIALGDRKAVSGRLLVDIPREWLRVGGESPLLEGPFQVSDAVSWQGGTVRIHRLEAVGNAGRLVFAGTTVPGAHSLEGTVYATSGVPGSFKGLLVDSLAVGASIRLNADGKSITGRMEMEGVRSDTAAAVTLDGEFFLRQPGGWGEWDAPPEYDVLLTGGEVRVGEHALHSARLGARGTFSPEKGLEAAALRLDLPDREVWGEGTGSLSLDGGFSCDTRIHAGNLAAFPSGLPVSGEVEARLSATGNYKNVEAEGVLSATSETLSSLPEALRSIEGQKIACAATWRADRKELSFSDGMLDAPAGKVSGEGRYSLSDGNFLGNGTVELQDLSLLSGMTGSRMEGKGELTATLSGKASDFAAKGNMTLSDFGMRGVSLPSLRGDFDLKGLPDRVSGPVRASVTPGEGFPDLSLKGRLSMDADRLSLEKASMVSGTNSASGSLSYDRRTGTLSGRGEAALSDLSPFGRMLGAELRGGGQIKGELTRKGDGLKTQAAFSLDAVTTPWFAVKRAEGDVSFDTKDGAAPVRATLQAQGVEHKALLLDSFAAEVRGAVEEAAVSFDASGSLPSDGATLKLSAEGRLSVLDQKVQMNRLEARVGDIQVAAVQPFTVSRRAPETRMEGKFSIGEKGGVEVSFFAAPPGPVAEIEWNGVPLSAARVAGLPFSGGDSSGHLSLWGGWQKTRVALKCLASGAVLSGGAADSPPMGAELTLNSGDEGTDLALSVRAGAAGRVEGKGHVGAWVGMNPLTLAPDAAAAVDFEGSAEADLEALAGALALLDHAASGRASGTFKVRGTWGAPLLTVDGAVKNARYENLKTGTLLEGISGRISSEANKVTFSGFKARAGEGTVTADGHAAVSFTEGTAMEIAVALDGALMARTDIAQATANGGLRITGPVTHPAVSGKLVVPQVDVTMPERSAGQVKVVAFREAGAAPEAPRPEAPAARVALPVALNVELEFPGRCFVRGPVLDSEWRGGLRLGGTAGEPVLNGQMTAVRGHAGLLSTRFSLENSTVSWNGPVRNPYLGVRGTAQAAETGVELAIAGPLSDAQLALTSNPAMPQDEILSQLLFRRDLAKISPVQAVQLGRVARLFSGKTSVVELMTGFMRLPGVDMFDIRTGEKADEAVVGVGKYLNERIYVEVEQGTAADSGKVSAEVGVTPNISVKGDVGTRERGGVGLFWKHDY